MTSSDTTPPCRLLRDDVIPTIQSGLRMSATMWTCRPYDSRRKMTGRVAMWILVLGSFAWGAQSASVHATESLNARQAWAQSLDNGEAGIWWFAAGLDNPRLVVQLSPPSSDTAGCDSVIATLLVRQ